MEIFDELMVPEFVTAELFEMESPPVKLPALEKVVLLFKETVFVVVPEFK